MNIIGVHSRVSPFLIAVVLLLQLSPALATGQPDAQQAIKGSRPVEVTFTKWRTAVVPPPPAVPAPGTTTRILFKGFSGGDLGEGDFVAEVLERKASTLCTAVVPPCTPDIPVTGSIASLEAAYEVRVGDQSFIALIQGGSTSVSGRLEGVIVSGWRLGAHVRVAFETVSSCTDREGVTHGPCFVGSIQIERD